MAKNPPKNLKIKSSNNDAAAVEMKQPSHQTAIEYIDGFMQKAPGTRTEHITGQRALQQLAMAIQGLKQLPELQKQINNFRSQAGIDERKIKQLQKQITKLKGN